MQITVHAASATGKLPNFWNNFHFHPTDAVEDLWGQKILRQAAADHVGQYVRLYTMFEDVVTRDENGNLQFDFSQQDRRFDFMLEQGFKILLCFNFMPVVMGKDPNALSGLRYKDKRFCCSAPADYAQWQELCYAQTKHLVDRYGEEEVSTWRFHCWNEPDMEYWFENSCYWDESPDQATRRTEEYCRLLDHFVAGVRRACAGIPVGGPSAALSREFFARVIEHVVSGKNDATGEIGTPLDFISIHSYSTTMNSSIDPLRFRLAPSPENIRDCYRSYREILRRFGLTDISVIMDEWGAVNEGAKGIADDPLMRLRETEYYAAFYFRLIDVMRREPLPPERMMLCLSGQDKNTVDFDGHRTFFTARSWRKPVYNAFALAAHLGDELLPVQGETAPGCGTIATRAADGRVVVALYNHVSDLGAFGETVPVRLQIDGLPEHYTLRRWRIDQTCSNGYSAWCRLGCPERPTVWECEKISRHAELEAPLPDENGGFRYCGESALPPNAVEVWEFFPVAERQLDTDSR